MNEILTQEQSILSIEDRAEKSFKAHNIGQHDLANDVYTDGFIAGANEMLPIIKKLGEALIKANLYVPPKFYGQGESVDNEDHQIIRTTLDKYKNYL